MTHAAELCSTRFPVTDIARSRAFYEGLLELKPLSVFVHQNRSRVEYETGAGLFVITDFPAEPRERCDDLPGAVVEVQNLDVMLADLRDARVRFIAEPMLGSTGRFAIVADPDGHPVALQNRHG